MYANQWRIGLKAVKTSKLLYRWLAHHTTRQDLPVTSPKFFGITSDTTLSLTKHFYAITNLARRRLLKLLSMSTSTHGPSPSTTIRLFITYIRTRLEYGSAATCVANPSRFVQWERLPNTLNHDILRRRADQPTIHDRLLYLAKRWYSKAYENKAARRDFIPEKILKQKSIFSFLLVP